MTLWRNKNDDRYYVYMAYAIDCTKEREGLQVVILCLRDKPHRILVVEEQEFFDNYKLIGDFYPKTSMLSHGGI